MPKLTSFAQTLIWRMVGKQVFENGEKHCFPCRLSRGCDLRASRSQHALQSSLLLVQSCCCVFVIWVWISAVIAYCERQLMGLECGISVTFFNFSATVWVRLICCQFFDIFLEGDLRGAGEKNPCTTQGFSHPSWSKTKMTCWEASHQNTYLPCFQETHLNMAECNSHSRCKPRRYNGTNLILSQT